MDFTKQQLIGLFGAALLLLGVFLPAISMPMMGSISLFNNGKSDGMILLGLSIASILLIFLNRLKLLYLTGGLSTAILIYDFYKVKSGINEIKDKMSAQLEGNPFGGLADAMMNSVQLQYGWAVLFIGCIILVLTPIFKQNEYKVDKTIADENHDDAKDINLTKNKLVAHDQFSYNQGKRIESDSDAETKDCPFCAEPIRITAIKCKHCGSMLNE